MMSDGRRLLSVFCGAGGLDLGFEQAGFNVQLAFDIRPDAVLSHNKNRADKPAAAHRIDVRDITLAKLDELAGSTFKPIGVVGGPPCQSFSQANRSPLEDDPRHKLPFVYCDLIQKLNARSPLHFFVLENVVALRESPHVERFEELKKKLDKAGFRVHEAVLDASSYGVPQRRERLILVGLNKKLYPDIVWEAPQKVEVPAEHLTVRHAFKELPEPVHYRRDLKRSDLVFHPNHWCMAPKSKKFTTPGALVEGRRGNRSFKTLSWNLPSVTVAYGNREVHVHPDCKRRLSVLEAMRLQGFPDTYVLEGSLSSQITQVSEAVPPPMAKAIAQTLKQILDRALLDRPTSKAKTVAKIKTAQPKDARKSERLAA
jgi:DNA (cytosine-5)-methyltransferase 1